MGNDETTRGLGLAAVLGTGSTAQMQATMAPLLPPEQLVALVRELAAQHDQQGADLATQRVTIAGQKARVAELAHQLDQEHLVVERLEAELRARRLSRGEVPRNVGDLLGWREKRQLTQAEAADVLGVGRATIERAEAEDLDTPLGRALQRALIRYSEAMNAADTPLPPAPKVSGKRKRSSLLPE